MSPTIPHEVRPVPASTALVLAPVFLFALGLTLYLLRAPLGRLLQHLVLGNPPDHDVDDIPLERLGADVESRFQRREWRAFRQRAADDEDGGKLRYRSPRSYFHECSAVERTLSPSLPASRPGSQDSSSDARSDLSRELDRYFDRDGAAEASGYGAQRIPPPSLADPLFLNEHGVLETQPLLPTSLGADVLAQATEPSELLPCPPPPASIGPSSSGHNDRSTRNVRPDDSSGTSEDRGERATLGPVDRVVEGLVGWLAKKGEDDSWRKWDEPPWKAAEA